MSQQVILANKDRFIEWMQPPLRSTFYKLWGKIEADLEKDIYRLTIKNDARLSKLNIEKAVVFQNVSWLGGSNPWMYYAYFCMALFLMFAGGSLMYIRKLEHAERQD